MIQRIKNWASKIKRQLLILHLAYQDARTPWFAKALIFLIIAYALSPIDLIPDFIPILGYLDDLILLPIGIYFAIKLIPKSVIHSAQVKIETYKWNKKNSLIGAIIVSIVWLGLGVFLYFEYF